MRLTASAISLFLKSPRAYYWAYVHKNGRGVEPPPSMQDYSHDLVFGQLWGEFVSAFYLSRYAVMDQDWLREWRTRTDSWVDDKTQERYAATLTSLILDYQRQFSIEDGARTADSSERKIENERFYGYLDGISTDGIIHECKTSKRSPDLNEQLWRVQNSIQVKLYAVLTRANGVRIEFAFKDAPVQVFRAPLLAITSEQRETWERQLNTLHAAIASMGTDAANYPCHPDGCTLITKGFVGRCKYRMLCDGDPAADTFYTLRNEERR
jgi:hypothetical protein